jgi:hypothetical protein
LRAEDLNSRLVAEGLVEPAGEFVTTWLDGIHEVPDRTSELTVTGMADPVEVDNNRVVVKVTYHLLDDETDLLLFVELDEHDGQWKVVGLR